MNLKPLIEELKKPEYEGKTDEVCVALVVAKTVVVRRPVPINILKRGMIGAGIYGDIKITASDELSPPTVRKAAINALGWIETYEGASIDLDSDLVRTVLDGLVSTGFTTQEAVDELLNQVNHTIPWIQSVGLDKLGIGFVALARQG